MNIKTKKQPDSWFLGFLKSLIPVGKPLWLSWMSILFSFWLALYPVPREPLFIVVLFLPLVGLIIQRYYYSNFESLLIIRSDIGKGQFVVHNFILFPALALGVVCLSYHCGNYFKILEIGTIGFVLVLALTFAIYGFIGKTNTDRLWIYLSVVPAIALYSYSAIYVTNCEFDNSQPLIFHAKVIGKYATTGRNSGYYLTLSTWGKHNDTEDVSVSSVKYKSSPLGKDVKIYYRRGLLSIPWYDYIVD